VQNRGTPTVLVIGLDGKWKAEMFGDTQDFQKMSQNGIEAMTNSLGFFSKSAQAISTEMTDYSKRSFEKATKAMEKLTGVTSPDKAIQVHTAYLKAAYEDHVAQVTKLGQLYSDMAKEAFKPFESIMTKTSATK
jgi:hypothetical protein